MRVCAGVGRAGDGRALAARARQQRLRMQGRGAGRIARHAQEQLLELRRVMGEDTFYALFRTPGADARRCLIYVNGSDGAVTGAWTRCAAAALARGWTVVTVDGPGQNAALIRQGIPFRPDWEAVLTPVLDAILPRADVDEDHVALIGMSQAGYWVPRAIAFEHRFAAAAVEPAILDASIPWLEALPSAAREALYDCQPAAFEREMHLAHLFDPASNALLRRRGRWYDSGRASLYELYQRIRAFRRGRLHDHAPAALQRFFQQGRQYAFERHVLQMVEQDFRHPTSTRFAALTPKVLPNFV